jgi:UTP-glucose-1-phosphate uridylyltransferase
LLNQDPILPKDRFVDMILTMWEINQVLNKAKQIRNDITSHRDNHLLKFRKLTGKDIDIFKINGYIDSIDDIIDEQNELSEKYIKWLERVYNYDRKGVL